MTYSARAGPTPSGFCLQRCSFAAVCTNILMPSSRSGHVDVEPRTCCAFPANAPFIDRIRAVADVRRPQDSKPNDQCTHSNTEASKAHVRHRHQMFLSRRSVPMPDRLGHNCAVTAHCCIDASLRHLLYPEARTVDVRTPGPSVDDSIRANGVRPFPIVPHFVQPWFGALTSLALAHA